MCASLPVEVRCPCVLVGQLQPGISHHLVDIGTLVGIWLKKLLQKTDGSCNREGEMTIHTLPQTLNSLHDEESFPVRRLTQYFTYVTHLQKCYSSD